MKKILVVLLSLVSVVAIFLLVEKELKKEKSVTQVSGLSQSRDTSETLANEQGLILEEESVGPYEEIVGITTNAEGPLIAYNEQEQYFVKTHQKTFGPYDKSGLYDFPTMKPLGRTGWIFSYLQDNQFYLNISGQDFGPYERYAKGFTQDPFHVVVQVTGNHYIYSFRRGDDYFLNADGKEYGPYKEIAVNDVIIDETGQWLIWEDVTEKTYNLVLNGVSYGPFEGLTNYGKRAFAYDGNGVFMNGYLKSGKYYVSVKGKEYGPYDNFSEKDFTLMEMSREHYAFVFKRSKEWYLNVDGKEYGPYGREDNGSSDDLVVNGEHWAFILPNDKPEILLDGVVVGPFKEFKEGNSIDTFNLHKDGSWTVIVANAEQDEYVIRSSDGRKVGPYEDIRSVDSIERFRYEKGNQWFVQADNKTFGPFHLHDPLENGDLYIYSQGESWAFTYRKEENGPWFVNAFGKEYGPYEKTNLFDANISDYGIAFSYQQDNRWYGQVVPLIKNVQ